MACSSLFLAIAVALGADSPADLEAWILAALATSRERPDRAPPYAPVPDISHDAATGA